MFQKKFIASFQWSPLFITRMTDRLFRRPVVATENSTPDIFSRVKHYWTDCALAFLTIWICVFSTWYAYVVFLDNNNAVPKRLALSPGTTVFTINVVSSVTTFMVSTLLGAVLESLRWALATRQKGIESSAFLAMSRATALSGVVHLLFFQRGSHRLWSTQRILFAACAFLAGVILTNHPVYKFVYTPDDDTPVPVYAGIPPFDYTFNAIAQKFTNGNGTNNEISLSVLSLWFTALTYGFLSDPRFVVPVEPVICSKKQDENCTSFFLPGGLTQVHPINGTNFISLYSLGKVYNDSSAIITHRAPGYQMEFTSIDTEALGRFPFNRSTDCTQYGSAEGDSLYMCLSSKGINLLAGWANCPNRILDEGACFEDKSWIQDLEVMTSLSMFKRYATTAYHAKNNSVLSIESIEPPIFVPAANITSMAADLKIVYGLLMTATPKVLNISDPNFSWYVSSIAAQFDLGWALRLYENNFPGYSEGTLTLLRNFLAIPIHFASVALQWTQPGAVLADLNVTSTTATFSYRAVGQKWSLILFAVVTFSQTLLAIVYLAVTLGLGRPSDPLESSFFPEVDIVSRCFDAKSPDTGSDESSSSDNGGNIALDSDRLLLDFGKFIRERTNGSVQSSGVCKALRYQRLCVVDRGTRPRIVVRNRNSIQFTTPKNLRQDIPGARRESIYTLNNNLSWENQTASISFKNETLKDLEEAQSKC